VTGEFRSRQYAFRQSEIERAAGDEIIDRGCRSFTMDGVARRLGMSKATVYKHFSTRDDLARTVVARRCTAAFGEIMSASGSEPSDRAPADGMVRLAANLTRRCLGITVGSDGSGPPCCLREVVCPFVEHERIERAFREFGLQRPEGISFTQALMAATASVMQTRRAEHRAPDERDVQALLQTLFPNS
jgi:AcrR family transcriptional regulator